MTGRKTSFAPIADGAARLLVLGSLPGDRSLAANRYYAHPQNQFWALLSPAAGCDLTILSYDARLIALREARIALWDVVASAERSGSTDAAIVAPQANDLATLVAALPALRAIAFNGVTAQRYGRRALGSLAERFTIVVLPSSSPLHTVGIAAKRPAWDQLRQLIA